MTEYAEVPWQDYKIYGPYFHNTERRYVVQLYRSNKDRTIITLAKYRLEVSLGRRLTATETVDHKDNDKLNDDISIMKSESAAIRQYEKRGKSQNIASLQEVHIGIVKLEFQYELEVVPPTEPTLRKLDGDGEEKQED